MAKVQGSLTGDSDEELDAYLLGKPLAAPKSKPADIVVTPPSDAQSSRAPGEPLRFTLPVGKAKAIDPANVSDDELDSYLLSGAGSPAVAKPKMAAKPSNSSSVGPAVGILNNSPDDSWLSGAAKGAATGVIKGVGNAVGFMQNADRLVDYVGSRAHSFITGASMEDIQQKRAQQRQDVETGRASNPLTSWLPAWTDPAKVLPAPEDVTGPIFAKTGKYDPTTMTGRMAQTGVEAVTSAYGPGAFSGRMPNPTGFAAGLPVTGSVSSVIRHNALSQTNRMAPNIALGGAAAEGVTEATGDPLLGAAAGMGVGAASSAFGVGASGSVSPERARVAQRGRELGIPLGVAEITGSETVKLAGDIAANLPLSSGGKYHQAKVDGFTRAVSREMGDDATSITPDVMTRNRMRIGDVFNRYGQTATLQFNNTHSTRLLNAVQEATQVLDGTQVNPLAHQIQNIVSKINPNGQMTGRQYHAIIAHNSPLDRVLNSTDGNVRFYAGRIRDVLDDAMQSSLPPNQVQAFQQARYQYKVMKTIEDAVEKSTDGSISPPLLMSLVRKNFDNMAYNGGGNMGDIARAGQLLKPPPSSRTAERLQTGANMMASAAALGTMDWRMLAAATLPAATGVVARTTINPLFNSNFAVNRMLRNANGANQPNLLSRAMPQAGPAMNTALGAPAWPITSASQFPPSNPLQSVGMQTPYANPVQN